jgi:hypothetical protein
VTAVTKGERLRAVRPLRRNIRWLGANQIQLRAGKVHAKNASSPVLKKAHPWIWLLIKPWRTPR